LERLRSQVVRDGSVWRIRRPDGELVGAYGGKRVAQKALLRMPYLDAQPNPPRLTRDVAWAAAHDAGNRSMRHAGRTSWNEDDYNAAVEEFNRLWPYENPGGPHAAKMRRCIESVSRDPSIADPGAVCAASVMPGRRKKRRRR
jgi:hypothetical protein